MNNFNKNNERLRYINYVLEDNMRFGKLGNRIEKRDRTLARCNKERRICSSNRLTIENEYFCKCRP